MRSWPRTRRPSKPDRRAVISRRFGSGGILFVPTAEGTLRLDPRNIDFGNSPYFLGRKETTFYDGPAAWAGAVVGGKLAIVSQFPVEFLSCTRASPRSRVLGWLRLISRARVVRN